MSKLFQVLSVALVVFFILIEAIGFFRLPWMATQSYFIFVAVPSTVGASWFQKARKQTGTKAIAFMALAVIVCLDVPFIFYRDQQDGQFLFFV
jgi:hypothetical protein